MGASTRHKIFLVQRTSPLSCGNVRCERNLTVLPNAGADARRTPDAWALAAAVVLEAMAFGALCAYLLFRAKVSYSPHVYYQHVTLSMLDFPAVLMEPMLAALLFVWAYPLMGLIVAYVCRALAAAIGRIYSFEPGEHRHPNFFLLFASSWPVTIWTIPLLISWLIMGILYKPVWK